MQLLPSLAWPARTIRTYQAGFSDFEHLAWDLLTDCNWRYTKIMTIIDNTVSTLSAPQPDALRGQSSQESQTGDFKSELRQAVGEFEGPSGGLAWVLSFREYDPNAKPTLPLKEGMLISALSGSQHPGYDAITGANYEVPQGWKLTRTLGGIPYLVHMNTLETMQVPYTSNPDPNNTYPVPLLPPPGPGSGEQTFFSAYRIPISRGPDPAPEIVNDRTDFSGKAIEDDKDVGNPSGFEVKTEDPKKQGTETRPIETAPKVDLGQIADSWIARLLDRYLDQDRRA